MISRLDKETKYFWWMMIYQIQLAVFFILFICLIVIIY